MLQSLSNAPWVTGVLLFAIGACAGSFVNVVAHRLPGVLFHRWKQECREWLDRPAETEAPDEAPPGLVTPGSRCPHCKASIRPWHNVPIFGYLLVGGRCARCGERISMRYPLVELFCAAASAHAGVVLGIGWPLALALVLLHGLVALSLIDLDHHLLPDGIVLPLLWLGLAANVNHAFTDLASAVTGAMAGYLVLWIVYQVHHRLTGRQGMGYGDFKLLAAIGAWLGWQSLPLVLLLSSLGGVIAAVVLMMFRNHGWSRPLPFGPCLAAAGWIALVGEDAVFGRFVALFAW